MRLVERSNLWVLKSPGKMKFSIWEMMSMIHTMTSGNFALPSLFVCSTLRGCGIWTLFSSPMTSANRYANTTEANLFQPLLSPENISLPVDGLTIITVPDSSESASVNSTWRRCRMCTTSGLLSDCTALSNWWSCSKNGWNTINGSIMIDDRSYPHFMVGVNNCSKVFSQ